MVGKGRRTLLELSHRFGGARVWDLVRGGRVKILMYHGVPAKEHFEGVENYWRYNVPLAEFRSQLEYLKRRCNVVSLADFLAGRNLSSKRTNVVLTFDDGYGNNYHNAWPVLEELGLPAVFAITTGFVVDRRPLWNDVVEHAVQTARSGPVSIPWNGEQASFDLSQVSGRVAVNNWALRTAVTVGQDERPDFLDGLFRALGADVSADAVFSNVDYQPMTPEELRALAQRDGVEIASHSVNHFLLAKLPRDEMRRELRDSKATLEELTGKPCTSLCMPGGSYDRAVLEEAEAAGFRAYLTSDIGPATAGAPTLNRYGVFSNGSVAQFADDLHGPVQPFLRATGRFKRKLRAKTRS